MSICLSIIQLLFRGNDDIPGLRGAGGGKARSTLLRHADGTDLRPNRMQEAPSRKALSFCLDRRAVRVRGCGNRHATLGAILGATSACTRGDGRS